MDHVRVELVHLFRELVSALGRDRAMAVVLVAAVVFLVTLCVLVFAGYHLLKFGESTVRSLSDFVKEIFKVISYHPRSASPAIRVELYLEAVLGLVVFVCVAVIAAHALIPWVSEHTEEELGYVIISALVLFAFLGYQSMRIANHPI